VDERPGTDIELPRWRESGPRRTHVRGVIAAGAPDIAAMVAACFARLCRPNCRRRIPVRPLVRSGRSDRGERAGDGGAFKATRDPKVAHTESE
jgi:hypothetical protein